MKLITIDMDGTLFDSWACCGIRDSASGSEACRHFRQDTWDRIGALLLTHAARLVVLSWRGGMVQVTERWLEAVGHREIMGKLFIPGSDDHNDLMRTAPKHGTGSWSAQVGFKARTVEALQAQGHEIVAAFDDNTEVLAALASLGVPTHLVERMVKVSPAEWSAGRLAGA